MGRYTLGYLIRFKKKKKKKKGKRKRLNWNCLSHDILVPHALRSSTWLYITENRLTLLHTSLEST
jgi:hypothetical protein